MKRKLFIICITIVQLWMIWTIVETKENEKIFENVMNLYALPGYTTFEDTNEVKRNVCSLEAIIWSNPNRDCFKEFEERKSDHEQKLKELEEALLQK